MDKIKVLIADDEIHICTLIKNIIDWDNLNLELIDSVYNGIDAFNVIREKSPDIVITDIRMPGLDGLELIKSVKENKINTHFIIISGYKYFDYAYSAIKYGVEFFLLKPIIKDDVSDALMKVSAQIRRKSMQKKNIEIIKGQYVINIIKIRKQFIWKLIFEDNKDVHLNIKRINEKYNYHFKQGIFQYAIIKLDEGSQSSNFGKNLLSRAVKILTNTLKNKCFDMESIETEKGAQIIFNYATENSRAFNRWLEDVLEEISSLISSYSFVHVTFGIGATVNDISLLEDSMHGAINAIKSRVILGIDKIIYASLLNISAYNLDDLNSEWKLNFSKSLEIQDKAAMSNLIKKSFLEPNKIFIKYPNHAFDLAESIINTFFIQNDFSQSNKSSGNKKNIIINQLYNCMSIKDITEYLTSLFSDLIDRIQCEANSHDRIVIQTVKQYIENHYNESIELVDIAQEVCLSPIYLSVFFKRETGVNISEYLINTRIEKAKELLRDIKLRICEISSKVGYKDTPYFSKLFLKNVGLKPSEYRKLYRV